MVNAYRQIGIFAFGAAAQQLTTDIAKYTIGRLRPHFFSVRIYSISLFYLSFSSVLFCWSACCTYSLWWFCQIFNLYFALCVMRTTWRRGARLQITMLFRRTFEVLFWLLDKIAIWPNDQETQQQQQQQFISLVLVSCSTISDSLLMLVFRSPPSWWMDAHFHLFHAHNVEVRISIQKKNKISIDKTCIAPRNVKCNLAAEMRRGAYVCLYHASETNAHFSVTTMKNEEETAQRSANLRNEATLIFVVDYTLLMQRDNE